MSKDANAPMFPGFDPDLKSFFKYPKMLEAWWSELTGPEQKVLDFILRQIVGFKDKESDLISYSQFVGGIGKRNRGTGLSLSSVRRAVDSLEKQGFIEVERHKHQPNVFRLRYAEGGAEENESVTESGEQTATNPKVVELIQGFEAIAPSKVKEYLRNKRHIKAIEHLLESYNDEYLAWVISALRHTNVMEYAPRVTSPDELAQKMPKLGAFIDANKETVEDRIKYY